MSANLNVTESGQVQFGEIGDRLRAWHKTGTPLGNENLTATEALEAIGGGYEVGIFPLSYVMPSGDIMETEFRQMINLNTGAQLGKPVHKSYVVLQPAEQVRLWDAHLRRSDGSPAGIETIAVLKDGENFFMTTKLPPMYVKDEEVEQYLMLGNPFTGSDAIQASIVAHRVVCQNTWSSALWALEHNVEGYTQHAIQHNGDVETHVSAWLEHLWENALMHQEALAEVYNILAGKPVKSEIEIDWIVGSMYPSYKEPQAEDYPSENHGGGNKIFATQHKQWESRMRARQNWVDLTGAMMRGQYTGNDSDAANGTLYGVLQAAIEVQNYGGKQMNSATHLKSLLFDNRHQHMRRAANAVLALARNEVKTEDMVEMAATLK